jgi:hypothetical protein
MMRADWNGGRGGKKRHASSGNEAGFHRRIIP